MRKHKTLLIFFVLFISEVVQAQVAKQILLEHFTNSLCSICASKNPDLNANLLNHPEVIRISYHPSSPYSNCVFNQHNISGNDDRTNQYGIYGGTPRIVIQGEVISVNQNFSDSSLFTSYKNQLSPILLNTYIDSISVDSVYVSVVAKTVDIPTNSTPLLYVALFEDTIQYSAPNGESTHYSVFRKALNGNTGSQVTLPNVIGDSVYFTYTSANHQLWNLNNLKALSVLQNETDLSVIQSSLSGIVQLNNSVITEQEGDEGFDIHFNGLSNNITILSEECRGFTNYEISAISGQVIKAGKTNGGLTYVSFERSPNGIYLIRLYNKETSTYSKALKFVK